MIIRFGLVDDFGTIFRITGTVTVCTRIGKRYDVNCTGKMISIVETGSECTGFVVIEQHLKARWLQKNVEEVFFGK